eukprot:TRINITY_DN708_c0_g1_i3.p1 TRINITY_DN708_c0_g1~~TRINITY_DN708_c0_g1_i3.p1  ORF type:complete len:392 (-),score=61.57 TRINITY_DN708_c0_g1_i3:46-1221(-)
MEDTKIVSLILQYLNEQGFQGSVNLLQKESNVDFIDNEDGPSGELVRILNEYQEIRIAAEANTFDQDDKQFDQDFMVQGEGSWHNSLTQNFDSLHRANILTLRFHPEKDLIATGSSDKSVKVFNYSTNQPHHQFTHHTGAVIALDFNPLHTDLLLAGSMDHSHSILDVDKKEVLQVFRDHTKYVNRIKWNPAGTHFVTSSHDGTIGIYEFDSVQKQATLSKNIVFSGIVEAIEFTKDGNTLIVAVREDNYLNYVDFKTYEIQRVNMNLNGDDHVSFTAMDLACNPSGTHVLVATDKNRMILYRVGTSVQVKNFYGSMNDRFSNPRLCWHPSSKYFYVTSQDGLVYVWDTVTQRIVDKLSGHRGLPKDIAFSNKSGEIASCSFDKTVKFWKS